MALAVVPGQGDETLAYLRERELSVSAYKEHRVPLKLASGESVTAVTYVVDPCHELYCGGLQLEEQAQVIARAAGDRGKNADYLINTVSHMAGLGIHDTDLCWLAARVKELIA